MNPISKTSCTPNLREAGLQNTDHIGVRAASQTTWQNSKLGKINTMPRKSNTNLSLRMAAKSPYNCLPFMYTRKRNNVLPKAFVTLDPSQLSTYEGLQQDEYKYIRIILRPKNTYTIAGEEYVRRKTENILKLTSKRKIQYEKNILWIDSDIMESKNITSEQKELKRNQSIKARAYNLGLFTSPKAYMNKTLTNANKRETFNTCTLISRRPKVKWQEIFVICF